MKKIVSISLGSSERDYTMNSRFLGEDFHIRRLGTDGDVNQAVELMKQWDQKAHVIGLGDVKFPYAIGSNRLVRKDTEALLEAGKKLATPVTIGTALRRVAYEWSLRHVNYKLGKGSYFSNARVLFMSGMFSYRLSRVMAEYTPNLVFADPLIEKGIPNLLNSLKELEKYATRVHRVMQWIPLKSITDRISPLRGIDNYLFRRAVKDAQVIVIPYQNFHHYIQNFFVDELGGKTVITATAYDDRVQLLKDRGVEVIIDTTPKILQQVVAVNVLEAMIMAALDRPLNEITDDDLLEIVSEQRMDPRVIYPFSKQKRKTRFAFVIHPLSQQHFLNVKPLEFISRFAPDNFINWVEKAVSYIPPFVYSKVTGIQSPCGVDAEGWLITIGGTPRQMLSKAPEFTYRQLLQAANLAKRLGAQIMGLGAFTKVVGDAGVTVSRKADIPITTGNSLSAAGAIWAAIEAVKRMGLIKIKARSNRIHAKAMVVGASGSIGAVCCRLLAQMFDQVVMVDIRDARLLALKQIIREETPRAGVIVSTRADKYLADMDVIVTTTSAAGKSVLDIMKVKPGCVITDVARPLDLSPEEVAKRPDVLVIESGEIELPGNPEMKNIGLPHKVAYACLAEVITLALEGRFENYTIGREIEWQKVNDIYDLAQKHGMKLAAISGHKGVYTDEDIAEVARLARNAVTSKRKKPVRTVSRAPKKAPPVKPAEKPKKKVRPRPAVIDYPMEEERPMPQVSIH
ncbi:MAG: dehydrogenase [Thermodesulfobacteriota bacterium]